MTTKTIKEITADIAANGVPLELKPNSVATLCNRRSLPEVYRITLAPGQRVKIATEASVPEVRISFPSESVEK